MTQRRFNSLRFYGPGTDLRVGLSPSSRWKNAIGSTNEGKRFTPNLPSEEIFSTPDARRTSGRVTVTKPVRVMGVMVENAACHIALGLGIEESFTSSSVAPTGNRKAALNKPTSIQRNLPASALEYDFFTLFPYGINLFGVCVLRKPRSQGFIHPCVDPNRIRLNGNCFRLARSIIAYRPCTAPIEKTAICIPFTSSMTQHWMSIQPRVMAAWMPSA